MAGFSKLLREGCAGVEESLQGRFTRGGAANARKRERDTETQLKEHHARLTAESKATSARLMQPRGHATPTTAAIAQTPYWPKTYLQTPKWRPPRSPNGDRTKVTTPHQGEMPLCGNEMVYERADTPIPHSLKYNQYLIKYIT